MYELYYCFQVLSFIHENKGMAEHLFKFTDEKLDAEKVVKILKSNFAPVGSNRRKTQEIVMAKFVAFLKCTEGNDNKAIIEHTGQQFYR